MCPIRVKKSGASWHPVDTLHSSDGNRVIDAHECALRVRAHGPSMCLLRIQVCMMIIMDTCYIMCV